MKRLCLLVLVCTLTVSTKAEARQWRVASDGTGDAITVQAGIDSAKSGDVVLVAAGTYYEDIDFSGKDIHLKSESGPFATVLDGSKEDSSVVIFKRGEGRGAILDGFTITGGVGSPISETSTHKYGGGIYCVGSASPIIRNNTIIANHATWGGGVHLTRSPFGDDEKNLPTVLMENNVIERNRADRIGGGVRVWAVNITLRGNVFRENYAEFDSGGLDLRQRFGTSVVVGNQFWGNVAVDKGGGIHMFGGDGAAGDVTVENNLFVRNIAHGADSGDSGGGGAIWGEKVFGIIRNNTFVFNEGYSETPGGGGGLVFLSSNLEITQNIIAFNKGCGMACRFTTPEVMFGRNLFWRNEGGAICGNCPEVWVKEVEREDPQFCDLDGDNFTVSRTSPALLGPQVLGAFSEPGCGPGVSVEPTSWGSIKRRYGQGLHPGKES